MAHPLIEKFAALNEEAKLAIKEEFKKFFTKYPFVEYIEWTQYAPYFNDGDACVFHVHEFEFIGSHPSLTKASLSDEDGAETSDDDDNDEEGEDIRDALQRAIGSNYDWETRTTTYGTNRPATPEEEQFLSDADELEDLCHKLTPNMEMMFGEHARVVATVDGFDVSEYDHE